jgi:hypothetical protein
MQNGTHTDVSATPPDVSGTSMTQNDDGRTQKERVRVKFTVSLIKTRKCLIQPFFVLFKIMFECESNLKSLIRKFRVFRALHSLKLINL